MAVEIFFCYAPEDKKLLKRLIKQLSPWRQQGLVTIWHDDYINAGQEWEEVIHANMARAQIIMLLVSPDFIASNNCYREMERAMERQKRGEAYVIPVILRPIHWQDTPFGRLEALPKNGKPITTWKNQDLALYNVAKGLYGILSSQQQGISGASFLSRSEMAALAAISRYAWHYFARRTVLKGLLLVGGIGGGVGGGVVLWRNAQGQQAGKSTQGKMLYTYRGHKDIVSSVSWEPGGTYIVSGSYDKTAQVWEATKGTVRQTYRSHTNKINAVAWSPKGTYIASASSDKTAQVWNATTGRMVTTYKRHSDVVTAVAWSPDGTQIATGSYDGTVQIWDAMTGKHILTYPLDSPSIYWINAVAWSSDGTYIASGNVNSSLDIWVAATGNGVSLGGTDGPPALAWSPDDKLLAVGGGSISAVGGYMSVEVDNAREGSVYSYLDATSASTLSVAWSPDGKLIAFGGSDNTARIWNPTDNNAFIYKGHSGAVRGVTWSPKSAYVASCSEDKTVQVWQGK